jgi:hypothetical protein
MSNKRQYTDISDDENTALTNAVRYMGYLYELARGPQDPDLRVDVLRWRLTKMLRKGWPQLLTLLDKKGAPHG